MFKLIFTLFCLVQSVTYADDTGREYNLTNYSGTNRQVTYNIPDAVADTNMSHWNNTNWANKMTDSNGYGSVGNTMTFMNSSPFLKKGLTSKPKDLTLESLNNDTNATPAVHGFSQDFRNSLMGTSSSNRTFHPRQEANTIKCFIARDLPFRYKCEETGLVYGGDTIARTANGAVTNMDGMSGKEALNLCKKNCKRQLSCVEVNATNIAPSIISDSRYSFDSNSTFSIHYVNTHSDLQSSKITFDVNATDSNDSLTFVDVSYTNRGGAVFPLITDLKINLIDDIKELPVKDYIKSIDIKIHSNDINKTISGKFVNTKLYFQPNNKYLCPALQEVSTAGGTTFAEQCPHGTITNLDGFHICSSGTVKGDNPDGSFSNLNACKSQCNIAKKCSIEIGSFDANIFNQIREGQLGTISADGNFTSAGHDIMSGAALCTAARNSNWQIINESVFDAQQVPYDTVVNGVLVPNVKRPRVMPDSSNMSYADQKKEEWKDGAYDWMISNGRYSSVQAGIGEDTNSSFAYNISLSSGADVGRVSVASQRKLTWRLKPNALSYSNDISYRLYAVIKVDVAKYEDADDGNATIVRDQIWYIKTSMADTFVPFIRAANYGSAEAVDVGRGQINPTVVLNRAATFEPQNFDTASSSWVPRSFSTAAPSFQSTRFIADDFWYEFNIISSFGDIIYKLPGLVRSSMVNGGRRINTYTGEFDGTGDGVVGYQIYTFFSQSVLTYQDIKNKIDAIDNSGVHQIDNYGAKIYQSTASNHFDKFIKPDNIDTNNNIDIYQYGSADKFSLKVRIKPRAEDIGKNAFIFIFMY